MSLISLCGWKQSGKSHAARVLVDELGYTPYKMAAPLKTIVSNTFQVEDMEAAKTEPVEIPEEEIDNLSTITAIEVLKQLGMRESSATDRVLREEMRTTPVPMLDGVTPYQMKCDVKVLYKQLAKGQPTFRDVLQQLGTDVMRNKWNREIHVMMLDTWLAANKNKKLVFDDVRFPNEITLMRKYGGKLVWLHRPSLTPTDFHESEVSIGESDCDVMLISREGGKLNVDILECVRNGVKPLDYFSDTYYDDE